MPDNPGAYKSLQEREEILIEMIDQRASSNEVIC